MGSPWLCISPYIRHLQSVVIFCLVAQKRQSSTLLRYPSVYWIPSRFWSFQSLHEGISLAITVRARSGAHNYSATMIHNSATMDYHSTLADHSSPLLFPKKTLPNEIYASQSCNALVSMLTIGDGDDSIFDSPRVKTPKTTISRRTAKSTTTGRASRAARLLFELDLPTNGTNKNRHTNRTHGFGDEDRLLREKRNSSMPML
jgi:hypothetical protein